MENFNIKDAIPFLVGILIGVVVYLLTESYLAVLISIFVADIIKRIYNFYKIPTNEKRV